MNIRTEIFADFIESCKRVGGKPVIIRVPASSRAELQKKLAEMGDGVSWLFQQRICDDPPTYEVAGARKKV